MCGHKRPWGRMKGLGRPLLWKCASPRGCRNSSFTEGGAGGAQKAAWKQQVLPSLQELALGIRDSELPGPVHPEGLRVGGPQMYPKSALLAWEMGAE